MSDKEFGLPGFTTINMNQPEVADAADDRLGHNSEGDRMNMAAKINTEPGSREALEDEHGQVWDTDQMTDDFFAIGFLAPFIMVERKSDGVKGTLQFQHMPRFYYAWRED